MTVTAIALMLVATAPTAQPVHMLPFRDTGSVFIMFRHLAFARLLPCLPNRRAAAEKDKARADAAQTPQPKAITPRAVVSDGSPVQKPLGASRVIRRCDGLIPVRGTILNRINRHKGPWGVIAKVRVLIVDRPG